MTIFPSSTDLRKFSVNLKTINQEIFDIEQKILNAITTPSLSITIDDTLMTTPNTQTARDYYSAWFENTDTVKKEQLSQIILYFSKKGYSINIIQNKTTLDTFKWVLSW